MGWPIELSGERFPGRVRREISVETEIVAGRVVFTGRLRDRWHGPLAGTVEEIHGWDVRMETEAPDLLIRTVEAVPAALPFPECPAAAVAVQHLAGERLSNGFRDKAIAALGGVEGCTHLLTLVLAIWSHQVVSGYLHGRTSERTRRAAEHLAARTNVCRGWREDGTAVELLRAGRPLPRSRVQDPLP